MQGEIELAVGVGPMFFTVNFQVIKVDSTYNMLLRRPWLHATGMVASTLHRRLKFLSKDLMVTIMAEEHLTLFKDTSIPYIGANCWKIWFCISYKTPNGSKKYGSTSFMKDNM